MLKSTLASTLDVKRTTRQHYGTLSNCSVLGQLHPDFDRKLVFLYQFPYSGVNGIKVRSPTRKKKERNLEKEELTSGFYDLILSTFLLSSFVGILKVSSNTMALFTIRITALTVLFLFFSSVCSMNISEVHLTDTGVSYPVLGFYI